MDYAFRLSSCSLVAGRVQEQKSEWVNRDLATNAFDTIAVKFQLSDANQNG